MRALLVSSFMVLSMILSAPGAWAEGEPVTRDDLEGLRLELNTLRDQWQRSLERNTAQTTRALKFNGTVQTRYTQTDDSSANSGFSLSFFLFSFRGSLMKDFEEGKNLDYVVSLSADSQNGNQLKPLDAYLQYSVTNSLDKETPSLVLSLGQQKKPFGRDPQTTEEYKPTINLAQFDSKLGSFSRDIGFIVKGDAFPLVDYGFNYRVPFIEYAFGVFNGSGQNAGENNTDKDYVGRVAFNAPVDYTSPFRGLSAGFSWWSGTTNQALTGTTAVTARGKRERWGADAAYVNTPIGLSAEYAAGADEAVTGTPANQQRTETKSAGYIVTAFYNFGQQFLKNRAENRYDDWYPLTYQPFVRYDEWDPNTEANNDKSTVTTVGLNWFFAETTKLQFNFNSKYNEAATTNKSVNEYLVQFQYGF